MDLIRNCFDSFYDIIKYPIFFITKNNPEKAHELFAGFCQILYKTNLEGLMLDNKHNRIKSSFDISVAAGFNKNGEIPPTTLSLLGFDRIVVGTVTGEEWGGNNPLEAYYGRQRIIRFPKTKSIVNWMGLPGVGAERVAENLESYGDHNIPITINLMATPNKKGDDALRDLEKTVTILKNVPYVDRFELNISCPNTTNKKGGLDGRKGYQRQAGDMIDVVSKFKNHDQEMDVKVSPDLNEKEIDDTLEFINFQKVRALTTTNTTTNYDPSYITESVGKGGASGEAVYADSLKVQKLFYEKSKGTGLKFNASGGINTIKKVKERLMYGAEEIQILTPFIFSGPKLLGKLR